VTRRVLASVAAVAWIVATAPVRADVPASEYAVKAAYIYNFVRYVEWPAAARARDASAVHVCVLGDDPFGPVLDRTLADKTVDGRRLVARRCATLADAAGCDLVFVPAGEEFRAEAVVRLAETSGMLTVGESADFAERGGMIRLLRDGEHVRFAINLGAIERAGLKMSSEVLKLAVHVTR